MDELLNWPVTWGGLLSLVMLYWFLRLAFYLGVQDGTKAKANRVPDDQKKLTQQREAFADWIDPVTGSSILYGNKFVDRRLVDQLRGDDVPLDPHHHEHRHGKR